ncbi:MAG: hypothetical protein JXR95_02550 [Deltaproteobacteria bacterium]|nr:hypothetical protein [Deltaproteobacteria bacterium]
MSFNISGLTGLVQTALPIATQLMGNSAVSSGVLPFLVSGGNPVIAGIASQFLTAQNGPYSDIVNEARKFLEKFMGMNKVRPHGKRIGSNDKSEGTTNYNSEINKILSSNMSIEEKIIMIAGLISDKLNGELEDELKKQSQAASGTGSAGNNSQITENKIQVLMGRLNRMQTTASNLIQSMHTTKKAMISNIRV